LHIPVLRDRGCVVTGIELDSGTAEAGRDDLDNVIVGDLKALDSACEFTGERADVVLAVNDAGTWSLRSRTSRTEACGRRLWKAGSHRGR
jgi:hypothetical protein